MPPAPVEVDHTPNRAEPDPIDDVPERAAEDHAQGNPLKVAFRAPDQYEEDQRDGCGNRDEHDGLRLRGEAEGDAGIHAGPDGEERRDVDNTRSEEHTSELQSLMRISYAVFCLNKTNNT